MSFTNTEIAFRAKSDAALRWSYWLFSAIRFPWAVKIGAWILGIALRIGLPVQGILRNTFFRQFCGGETIQECQPVIDLLGRHGIGTILDYSVEGLNTEFSFERTAQEIHRVLAVTETTPNLPFCVFKMTGIARFGLMEKISAGHTLDSEESLEWERALERLDSICQKAVQLNARVLVDAEESWIQAAIDQSVEAVMRLYNRERVVVYNTLQMYRHDRLEYLRRCLEDSNKQGYRLGLKLVRGAYMEKERHWAEERGRTPAVYPDKAGTDRAFNDATTLCAQHIERVGICLGTHNESSCALLVELMKQRGLQPNDPRVYFAQLYGMGDHISYNLANAGFNVAKYLPYGPIKAVFPYLVRRAEENSSIQGHSGRELGLIRQERARRLRLHTT